MANLFNASSRLARLLIQRSGHEVSVYRPDGTAPTNDYGKVNDIEQTLEHVSEEIALRVYEGGDNEPGYGEVTGGRVDTDSPRIAMMKTTNALEGDHVLFDDQREYVLDEPYDRDTHVIFRATLVSESLDNGFDLVL